MTSINKGEAAKSYKGPVVVAAKSLIDWYAHEKQEYDTDRAQFNAYREIPGAARDPEINELAGKLEGKQRVLSSFADMLVAKAGVIIPQSETTEVDSQT